MSQPDETNADILDAIALLTASHDSSPGTYAGLISTLLKEADSDADGETSSPETYGDIAMGIKLLGLVSGMTVVAKKLIEYGVGVTEDKYADALADLCGDMCNRTIRRHLTEISVEATHLLAYCAREAGVSHPTVLARLGKDLNTSSGE